MIDRRALLAALIGGTTYALALGLTMLGFVLLWGASDDVGVSNFLPVAVTSILLVVVLLGGPIWLAKLLGARGWPVGCLWAIVPLAAGLANASSSSWVVLALAPGALTLTAMLVAGRERSPSAAAVAIVTVILCGVTATIDVSSGPRDPLIAGLIAWTIIPMIGALGQPAKASDNARVEQPIINDPGSNRGGWSRGWKHSRSVRAGVVALAIVAGTVSCAGLLSHIQNSNLSVSIHVTGPLYGYVEGNGSVAGYPTPGGDIVGTTGYEDVVLVFSPLARFPSADHSFSYGHGSYTAHLTLTDTGPAFISIDSLKEGGGGLFGGDDKVKGRAVFVVSAPANAKLRLKGDTRQSVGNLRLEVDRDADGTFDEELKPDFVKSGDDIDDYGQFQTTATVTSNGAAQATVSLATRGEDRVDRTYYWNFPNDPRPQRYDKPIELTGPTYLLFASLDHDGNLEMVQGAFALGGVPAIDGSIDLDSAQTISFREPGQIARLTFEGRRDQRIVTRVTASDLGAFPCCTGRMQVLDPDGKALASETGIGATPSAMETVVLSRDGDYTLVVNPYLAYTGNVTIVLDTLDDAVTSIQPNGQPTTLTFEHAEQRGLVTFDGRAGQQISVVITIVEGFCCQADAELLSPDGTPMVTGTLTLADDILTLRKTLPGDGEYTVALAPSLQKPGQLTVELNSVNDVNTTLNLDAQPADIRIDTPGQSGHLTFTGSMGQQLFVSAHDSVASDDGLGSSYGDLRTRLSIHRQDSNDEIVRAWLVPRDDSVVAVTLPSTGQYVIDIDPPIDATGSLTVGLHSSAPETATLTAAALPINHEPVLLELGGPQSVAQRSFSAVKGQLVTLTIQDVVGENLDHCCSFWPHLFDPNGNDISYAIETRLNLFGTDGVSQPLRIPETGVYVIEAQPYETATGQFTMAITAIDDLTPDVTIGAPPVTIATTEPGQTARVTFSAQAGDVYVMVSMAEQGRATDDSVTYTIPGAETDLGRDDIEITPGMTSYTSFTLPEDGTYTIIFQPLAQTTFSISLAITPDTDSSTPVPEVVPQPVTIDGNPIELSLTDYRAGHHRAALSFSGTKGQRLSINVEVTDGPGSRDACCGYHIVVVGPTQPAMVAERDLTKGSTRMEVVLPSSGEYLIWFRTVGNSSGTLRVAVRTH